MFRVLLQVSIPFFYPALHTNGASPAGTKRSCGERLRSERRWPRHGASQCPRPVVILLILYRKLEAHRVRQDQGCVCPSANYIHPFCAVCNPELPSFEEAWPLVYPMSPIITPAQPPTEDDPIVSCTDPRAFAPVQTDTMVDRLVRWVERRGPTDRFAQALRDERNLATTEWRAWKWGTDLRSAIEDGRALLAAVKEMGDVGGKGPYEESIVHCEVLVKLMVECAAEDL